MSFNPTLSFYFSIDLSHEILLFLSAFKELGYTVRVFCKAPLRFAKNWKQLQFIRNSEFERINSIGDSPILVTEDPLIFEAPSPQQKFFWNLHGIQNISSAHGTIMPREPVIDINSIPQKERKSLQPQDYRLIAQKWVSEFKIFPNSLLQIKPDNYDFVPKAYPYNICWVVNYPEIFSNKSENPSYRILCENQNELFNDAGIVSDITDRLDSTLYNYDVLIFVRFGPEELKWIQSLQGLGKKVIFLHDENLYNLPYLEDTWRVVDAVACTSTKLMEKVKEQAGRGDHLFLNNCNHDIIEKTYYHPYTTEDPLVGWCGFSNEDLATQILKPLLGRNNIRLQFLTDISKGDIVDRIWDLDYHIDHINQFDIFVAPMRHDYFYAKSHVKLSIPALLGIPIVASPLESYQYIIEHGKSGFFCESFEDWEYFITILKNPELRKEIGQAGRANFLKYHGNKKATENWIRLFDKLMG